MDKKIIAQNTTYYSRKFDIMIRVSKTSMKVEQPKKVEELICSFFTTFAVFTNSTLDSLTPQNYFSLSYKTLKQTKDKTKKVK